jgi:hypothetical protein
MKMWGNGTRLQKKAKGKGKCDIDRDRHSPKEN